MYIEGPCSYMNCFQSTKETNQMNFEVQKLANLKSFLTYFIWEPEEQKLEKNLRKVFKFDSISSWPFATRQIC